MITINGKIIIFNGAKATGKTLLTAYLGRYLSRDKKVLLIDMDFENRDIHILFNEKLYEKEVDKNIVKTVDKNLDIISNFDLVLKNVNNVDNYGIFELEKLFLKIKEKYNYIIIDFKSTVNERIERFICNFSDYIILLVEGNVLSISRSKIIYEKINRLVDDKSKIKIILNKKNKESIDGIFISKYLKNNILGEIKYSYLFNKSINENFKVYLKNRDIERLVEKL